MFSRSFMRPLARSGRGYLAATATTTAVLGYYGFQHMEGRMQVHADGPGPKGTRNWDNEKQQYDDDLKVNRHKIAAQKGTTPLTPLHNSGAGVHIPNSSRADSDNGTTPQAAKEIVEEKAKEAEEKEDSSQQSAYNEETGEINWDCPCLGGMAHGPCGQQFRDAFSCFVYSEQEPKGIDCVEKFKAMQDCFRQHPDVYGAELEDEEPANSPLTTTEVKIDGPVLPGDREVPKTPNKEPPANLPHTKQTHNNNPSKGVVKLQPSKDKEPASIVGTDGFGHAKSVHIPQDGRKQKSSAKDEE